MKKPIFNELQRRTWPYPEIEIAKLQFKRAIQKSSLGKLIIRFSEWLDKLFSKRFPCCLAEELSIKTPFTVEELQEMINRIKVFYGFTTDSKEAEKTHIIKEKSYRAAVHAMENNIKPWVSAIILYDPKTIKIEEDEQRDR